MKLAIAILAFTIASFAQTVVVPLSPEDAARVKSVKEQVDAVNKLWENLQKEIGKKYLVVEKDSPDASDHSWYEDSSVFSPNSITWASSGSFLVMDGSGHIKSSDSDECRTPEEIAKNKALHAKAEAEQKKAEEEQYARAKRIHKGFDNEHDFIFSDDWKYLLPKPPTTSPYNSNQWYITPTGPATPGGLLTDPGIVAK